MRRHRGAVSCVGKQVTGDVLAHELVVRHILVKGANHVIAIPPRLMFVVVVFVAVRLRITDQVQPMPRPPFAVMRRREQTVHHFLEALGDLSLRKASVSAGVGGKANQVICHAAEAAHACRLVAQVQIRAASALQAGMHPSACESNPFALQLAWKELSLAGKPRICGH